MRKTRLVILPGVRSLNKIGCLLLFLACPTIAFKGQENREVEPLCKAQDLKELWVQESPWPGDLGGLVTRKSDLGSRPRLDTLTKHTCNVDAFNRKLMGVKLESQRTLAVERRETKRRLGSSVDSRSRSQDSVLDSRRLVQRRGERVAETRAEMNRFSDERRQLDERRASTYRADTRMVNTRERITRENGSRRDLNRMDRSNTRSVEKQIRSEDREGRLGTDNMRRSLSLDRRTRSMENIRKDIRIRSQLQDREVRSSPRKSELWVYERNTRREIEIRDARSERNSESRFDAMRIRQEATRSTAQPQLVVRTIRERVDGGVRRMESSRRNQNVRNNQRDVRSGEHRQNLGEIRMDRDDIRDSRLPAMGRLVTRYTRSIEDVRRTDRRASGATRDMEDTRREIEIKDRRSERNSESRFDAMRIRQEATRSTAQPQLVVRTIRERVDGVVRRMESSRRNQNVRNNQRDVRSGEHRQNLGEMRMDRDDIRDSRLPAMGRLVTRYTRSIEDVRRTDRRARGAARDMEAKQADSRRNEDSRRETTSVEKGVERMDRNQVDIRRRQIGVRNTRSLEGVERSDRRARISTRENRREENRRNSETRMQHRSIEREMQARDSIRTGIRNTREDISEGSIRVRDSRRLTSTRSVEEMRRVDRTARAASDDNRVRQVENRRIGDVRRETRSMERKVDSIQDTIDVRRESNDIQDSRLLTRNTRSVQDVRRSYTRDQSLSRRGVEVRQQRTTMRRDINRIEENRAEWRKMNDNIRVLSDGRRSVSQDEMDSRRSSTKRQIAGVSRDMRRSTREAELTRQIGRELRRNGESQRETMVMRRGMSPMVERATDSTRIIRSDAGRSQRSGTVGFMEREKRETSRKVGNRREGEIKRETRSLKMLKPGNGYRLIDENDVKTERDVRNTGRSIIARFGRSDTRSVDGLRRLERVTRLGSHDRETRQVDNRRAREFRSESRSREIIAMERRMDARSSSAEFKDSRAGNPVRLLARDSRSAEDVRRSERRARIVSNERDSSPVDNRRNDEDHIRNMNQLEKIRNVIRKSDRRAQRAGNDWEIRRVEIRRSEDNRREVRSLERETSSMGGLAHRRKISLDNRSSRLLRARSVDDTRRSDRRAEFDAADRKTRRSENRRNLETQRGIRNFVVNMNLVEKRRTEMRRIQIDARGIRSTEGTRRFGQTAQLSRADRGVRRVENVRSVDGRREREIRRLNIKPVDVRRTHTEDKDSRFTTAADSRQSDQIHSAREETRRTNSRRDERSPRNVMRMVREVKSFDDSRAETRKASVAIRSVEDVRRIERTARNNPKGIEMRRVPKNPDSRTQEVRRIMETRDIYYPETKMARTVKPESTDRRTISAERLNHKWTALPLNAEQIYGRMTQKTDYYEAAKSVVTNWLDTFDLKMTDVSRLGETMLYGGIVCCALFANVNKKAIF